MKKFADIGLIGLAVMGENLALNLESRGFTVAVFNRTAERTERFLAGRAAGKNFLPAFTLAELTAAVAAPRRFLLMVKAGAAVDQCLAELVPHLSPGDTVIDGGNSFFEDTIRRGRELEAQGIHFVGAGISGGETGALLGPSIMPGCPAAVWPEVRPLLQAIAARAPDGASCCERVGDDGAGHYVKMVHNGIEYGDMQLIGEAWWLLKHLAGLTPEEQSDTFRAWNRGELDSYLVEITADILGAAAPDGRPLVERILDVAGQKGTGRWATLSAVGLGVAAPTIADAVFARDLSVDRALRQRGALLYPSTPPALPDDPATTVEAVRQALYAAKICSYAQGFQLLRRAAAEYRWTLDFSVIARLWRGGCIIRARFLDDIRDAFARDAELPNLIFDPFFRQALQAALPGWRRTVAAAVSAGLPTPALAGALAWFDGCRSATLPTGLLQAQRDYFGAHTYERTDRPRGQFFHTDWNGDRRERQL